MPQGTGLQDVQPGETGDSPCRRHRIVARPAGSDIVLYDAARGRLHVLNPTAAFVWDLCDGSHSTRDIATRIGATFTDSAGHDTAADVEKILDSFKKEDLLEESSGQRFSPSDQATGRHT